MIVWSIALAYVIVAAEKSFLKLKNSNFFRNIGVDGSDSSCFFKVTSMLWKFNQSVYQHFWRVNSPTAFYDAVGFISVFWSFGNIRLADKLQRTATDHEKIDDGQWDENFIRNVFSEEDANLILSLPVVDNGVEDKILWHYSKNGEYSVKSGYKIALDMLENAESSDMQKSESW
ncbi:hypothetical protein POM88_000886 [Heracleum sosnowskyi]|uniref:Uncharacterized protein n=1 Tax=Heracleum sosnowskyi TaxID=360622 RepID=A0AAD8NA69_9APIA|nr:hypothetical protein POM88_000886 [Heracleum sosnowskyi]